jgi:hypothetical protein
MYSLRAAITGLIVCAYTLAGGNTTALNASAP